MQILTFCPFFELQKAVLGDLIFEGSNQLQIQKFQLGWKVDFQNFPTSYPALDLDSREGPQKALPKGATSQARGATSQAKFASF